MARFSVVTNPVPSTGERGSTVVRRWAVQPDMGMETDEGVVGVVSRESLTEAVLDGVSMLDRAGGVLTIVVGRRRTDMDGEAVTTGAAVEWKSGPRAPAHPEANVDAPGVGAAPEPVEEADELADLLPEAEAPQSDLAAALGVVEDEDLSAIPVEQR